MAPSEEFADKVVKFLQDRVARYPDAVEFSLNSVLRDLEIAEQIRARPDFTPAFLAADSIVPDGRGNKALFDRSWWGQKPEAAQGYFDSVAMFVAASMAGMLGVGEGRDGTLVPVDVPMVAILERWPQFALIPEPMKSHARTFVESNAHLGHQVTSADLKDGRHFMDLLVDRAAALPESATYQSGVRAARDTLLLFVDLITASLAGKF